MAFTQVIERHVKKRWDSHGPDDHAVRAECANVVDALENKPVNEKYCKGYAGLNEQPEPALKLRTGQ